jgi:hypothetical protein
MERKLIACEGEYELWHERMCKSVSTGEPTGLHTICCRHCGEQIGGGEAVVVELMWKVLDKSRRHKGCSGDA